MTLAITRYVFSVVFKSVQYRYRNEILTIFPNSKAEAIIIADNAAPANNLPIPVTEKTAAHTVINIALKNTSVLNFTKSFIYSPNKWAEPFQVRPILFSVS